MPDVEFLEPTDLPAAPAPPPRLGRHLLTPLQRCAALAWIVAAAAAVAAPFQRIWTVRFRGAPARFAESVDGWGRFTGLGERGVHEARFGVVFCVAAGVLAVAVVVGFLHRQVVTTLLATAATAALAALTAVIYLSLDALAGDPDAHVRTGPCVWLALAATLAALLGLVAHLLPAAATPRTGGEGHSSADERPEVVEWEDPDAEVL